MFIGDDRLFDITEEYLKSNIYDDGFLYSYKTIQDLVSNTRLKLSRKAINQIGIIS